jgi:hypothetical protein
MTIWPIRAYIISYDDSYRFTSSSVAHNMSTYCTSWNSSKNSWWGDRQEKTFPEIYYVFKPQRVATIKFGYLFPKELKCGCWIQRLVVLIHAFYYSKKLQVMGCSWLQDGNAITYAWFSPTHVDGSRRTWEKFKRNMRLRQGFLWLLKCYTCTTSIVSTLQYIDTSSHFILLS